MGKSIRAWMSHGDAAEKIPSGFEIIGPYRKLSCSSYCK